MNTRDSAATTNARDSAATINTREEGVTITVAPHHQTKNLINLMESFRRLAALRSQ